MPGPIRKQLLCPGCAAPIATATYRRWPGNLVLTAPDGSRIVPVRGAVAREQAERDGDPEHVERVRGNHLDLFFRLRCRAGHTVLRTAPELIRVIRRTPGQWVTPE